MEAFRLKETQTAGIVGLGARVLLLAADGQGALARQVLGFGGRIDHEMELYTAMSALIEDPAGWDVFIVDCDAFDGLEACQRAHLRLGAVAERVATILLSKDCATQTFPDDRALPVVLRSPSSSVALRVGLEHALRGRRGWRSSQNV